MIIGLVELNRGDLLERILSPILIKIDHIVGILNLRLKKQWEYRFAVIRVIEVINIILSVAVEVLCYLDRNG